MFGLCGLIPTTEEYSLNGVFQSAADYNELFILIKQYLISDINLSLGLSSVSNIFAPNDWIYLVPTYTDLCATASSTCVNKIYFGNKLICYLHCRGEGDIFRSGSSGIDTTTCCSNISCSNCCTRWSYA